MRASSLLKNRKILIMSARYYNGYGYEDDDDYDDYDDYYYYDDQVEESQSEEENLSNNDLNDEEMSDISSILGYSWFITLHSAKCEYKLAMVSIVTMRLLRTTETSRDGFARSIYDGLEFMTSAGLFVCKGVGDASGLYYNLSNNFKRYMPHTIIGCDSLEFIPWSSMSKGNPDNDNHANQLNQNNPEFQHSRGEK